MGRRPVFRRPEHDGPRRRRRKRIAALGSAFLARDRSPATLARVRWEGERIKRMLRHALAPVIVLGEKPADAALAAVLTAPVAVEVDAPPAGG